WGARSGRGGARRRLHPVRDGGRAVPRRPRAPAALRTSRRRPHPHLRRGGDGGSAGQRKAGRAGRRDRQHGRGSRRPAAAGGDPVHAGSVAVRRRARLRARRTAAPAQDGRQNGSARDGEGRMTPIARVRRARAVLLGTVAGASILWAAALAAAVLLIAAAADLLVPLPLEMRRFVVPAAAVAAIAAALTVVWRGRNARSLGR